MNGATIFLSPGNERFAPPAGYVCCRPRLECLEARELLSLPGEALDVTFATADGPVTVADWGYQLQGPASVDGELRPGPLAEAPHDLLVIDFARYGDEASKFTPVEIAQIQNGPNGRRLVAAYVSIGEASEFRSYWDTGWTSDGTASGNLTARAPGWLGPVNPDWPESRKVRYWDAGWQDVIVNDAGTGWLDQVVAQGFDAAYLDIVDAYYFWGAEVRAGDRRPGDPQSEMDAAKRMIDFVVAMTASARATNPDFFVIPQNGEFILDALEGSDPARKSEYLDAIGAIAVEDTYFAGGKDENNAYNPDRDKIAILKQDFSGNNIPVFATDYVNRADLVEQFYGLTAADGFIGYAAPDRDLDRLAPPYSTGTLPDPAFFTDNFDRPDGTDLGPAWLETGGEFALRDHQLRAGELSTAQAVGASVADVELSADVRVQTRRKAKWAGLEARVSETGDRYRALAIGNRRGEFWVRLEVAIGGVWETLAETDLTSGAGRLELQLAGNVLTVKFDGATVLAVDDGQLASGAIGVVARRGTLDNFSARVAESPAHFAINAAIAMSTTTDTLDTDVLSAENAAAESARRRQSVRTRHIDRYLATIRDSDELI